MCVTVLDRDSGELLDGVEQVEQRVGWGNIVWRGGYDPATLDGNCCLCPVNVEKTFRQAGYRVSRGFDRRDGWTDFEIKRKPLPPPPE